MNHSVLPSTATCRLLLRDRLWLTVASVGLDGAGKRPDEEGGLVSVMDRLTVDVDKDSDDGWSQIIIIVILLLIIVGNYQTETPRTTRGSTPSRW